MKSWKCPIFLEQVITELQLSESKLGGGKNN
jgi:hypothetical protein